MSEAPEQKGKCSFPPPTSASSPSPFGAGNLGLQTSKSTSVSLFPLSPEPSPPARPTARASNYPQLCSPFSSLHLRDETPPGITAQQPLIVFLLLVSAPTSPPSLRRAARVASGRAALSLSSDRHSSSTPVTRNKVPEQARLQRHPLSLIRLQPPGLPSPRNLPKFFFRPSYLLVDLPKTLLRAALRLAGSSSSIQNQGVPASAPLIPAAAPTLWDSPPGMLCWK